MAIELANPQTDRAALTGLTFEVAREAGFEAAHYMPVSPDEPRYRRLHGHSFRVQAVVRGAADPERAMTVDLGKLGAALEALAGQLDHRCLNEIEGLSTPTLETLCVWFAIRLKPQLPGLARVTVSRPTLHESCTLTL